VALAGLAEVDDLVAAIGALLDLDVGPELVGEAEAVGDA